MKNFHIAIALLCCFLCSTKIRAQQNIRLKVIAVDSTNKAFSQIQKEQEFSSTQTLFKYIEQLPVTLSAQGFITASVDSIGGDSTENFIYLFLGKKYSWQHIKLRTNDALLLQQLNIDSSDFNNQILMNPPFKNSFNTILDYYTNNGYPFAKISLDSVQMNDDKVSAVLNIDKGIFYNMDSIHIVGTAKLSPQFLHRYLNFNEGEMYDAQKLRAVDGLLQNLQYVRVTKPSDVRMYNAGAVLNLYLDKKPTNEVDAILGFQPQNGNDGGKLQLTGQVNLDLANSFGGGENIGINWQQLQPQSPRINLQFQKPYLFKSPFGIDFSFNL
ncbi:MAG TPA: POTRA domain-containing protein, partial [Arachidicoccus sp.]